MAIFGYARCSIRDQIAQVAELRAAGCVEVYCERANGANGDHSQRVKVLTKLLPGDVLVVTRLSRLARSTYDLFETLHALAERNVGFKSIREAWADTTCSPNGQVMLEILGHLAEFERELIKTRITRARARGIRWGHHRKLNYEQRSQVLALFAAGERRIDIARTYGVSRKTIARTLKQHQFSMSEPRS